MRGGQSGRQENLGPGRRGRTRETVVLGAWAQLFGLPAGGRRPMRILRVVLAVVLAVGAITWWVRRTQLGQAVWPRYTGYIGSNGERSMRDYATSIRTARPPHDAEGRRRYGTRRTLPGIASRIIR